MSSNYSKILASIELDIYVFVVDESNITTANSVSSPTKPIAAMYTSC